MHNKLVENTEGSMCWFNNDVDFLQEVMGNSDTADEEFCFIIIGFQIQNF